MSADTGSYTQVPNFIFDLMRQMGDAELRIVLYLVRMTCGYHRPSVDCSLSAFQKATGLSRQGAINGISAGIERGTITRKEGRRGGFVYQLVNEVDQSTDPLVNEVDQSTSQPSGLVAASTSQRSRPVLVNVVDQYTPVLKKKEIGWLVGSLPSTRKKIQPTNQPQPPNPNDPQQLALELLKDPEVGIWDEVAEILAAKLPAQDIYRAVDGFLADLREGKVRSKGVLRKRLEKLQPSNAPTINLSAKFRDSELFHRHRLPDEMVADPERKQYSYVPEPEQGKRYSV